MFSETPYLNPTYRKDKNSQPVTKDYNSIFENHSLFTETAKFSIASIPTFVFCLFQTASLIFEETNGVQITSPYRVDYYKF
jgi:hypothetical protein